MTPSPQQAAVIDFVANGSGSAFVEAVAGAGKTTTLIEALGKCQGYISFAAFNKKIADEIKAKVADRSNPDSKNFDPEVARLGNRLRIGTFHSFGLGAWRRAYPDVQVAKGSEKTEMMIAALDLDDQRRPGNFPSSLRSFVPRLISLAKSNAAGINWNIDDHSHWYGIIDHHDMQEDIETDDLAALDRLIKQGVELAIRGLRWHREMGSKIVDFDDMLWLPVVNAMRLFQVDWFFGDESQDTNAIRRALARKMLKPNGRALWVGDRYQGIYAFTGADNDAVDLIIRDFKCTTLPLTVTFRCPKAVVHEAQQGVPHIQAHDTAPEGSVHSIPEDVFIKTATAIGEIGLLNLSPSDAILCRNTKPLVAMAYQLIKRGVACHVEGRDIGMNLLKLVNRFESSNIDQFIERLQAYGETQGEKLKAKGRETQAAALWDRIDTILVIADGCKDADCVRTKIFNLFQDSDTERKPSLTLSSIHKSKGREWPRVFILGRNMYMPSPFARQQYQIDQERNILYVSQTRAQRELVYIDVEAR